MDSYLRLQKTRNSKNPPSPIEVSEIVTKVQNMYTLKNQVEIEKLFSIIIILYCADEDISIPHEKIHPKKGFRYDSTNFPEGLRVILFNLAEEIINDRFQGFIA